ncbi:hypothetical protein OPIT5_29300 [Opitutaceae bacterium TAV5]|nr:hypothetical protein OPIT5_21820 [Opitutaceae bacterium TAV5]AHF94884.1 hypothetical protein OPIT5_29300 [Opitutaceae bacterium TAV5]
MNPDQSNTKYGPLPFVATAAIARTRLVKLVNNAGNPAVSPLAALTDIPAFYTNEAVDNAGGIVDVNPLDPQRNHRLWLTGAANPGDVLVSDGAGGVKVLPAAAGTYVRIGIAEETGVDGQIILLRPHLTGLLQTVAA